jgi:hypothetical protein
MPRSIIGWFIVCWSAFLLASVVVGILLLSLYRQSTTEQLRRASAAIAHGCDAVAGRYQFFMAGATRPPSDIRAPQFAQGLTSAVQIARKVDLTGAFLRAPLSTTHDWNRQQLIVPILSARIS